MIPFVVSRPRPRLDDSGKERFQRISKLSEDDRGFSCLLTVEFLTNVSLIPTKGAVELVDAPLKASMP